MISVQIDSTTGSEVVSTADLKSYARIETSDDDTIVLNMVKAAREKCEALLIEILSQKQEVYLYQIYKFLENMETFIKEGQK